MSSSSARPAHETKGRDGRPDGKQQLVDGLATSSSGHYVGDEVQIEQSLERLPSRQPLRQTEWQPPVGLLSRECSTRQGPGRPTRFTRQTSCCSRDVFRSHSPASRLRLSFLSPNRCQVGPLLRNLFAPNSTRTSLGRGAPDPPIRRPRRGHSISPATSHAVIHLSNLCSSFLSELQPLVATTTRTHNESFHIDRRSSSVTRPSLGPLSPRASSNELTGSSVMQMMQIQPS